jgi:hypothetical protein
MKILPADASLAFDTFHSNKAGYAASNLIEIPRLSAHPRATQDSSCRLIISSHQPRFQRVFTKVRRDSGDIFALIFTILL